MAQDPAKQKLSLAEKTFRKLLKEAHEKALKLQKTEKKGAMSKEQEKITAELQEQKKKIQEQEKIIQELQEQVKGLESEYGNLCDREAGQVDDPLSCLGGKAIGLGPKGFYHRQGFSERSWPPKKEGLWRR